MSEQQFRLLMLALLVGFGGLFAYALFGTSGLFAVIAVWLVYEARGVVLMLARPREPTRRDWLRALKEAEKAGDEQAMISIALLLNIPWQEQLQMLKRLRQRDVD